MCKNHSGCGHSHSGVWDCREGGPEGREDCCHGRASKPLNREQRIRHYRHRIECLQGLLAEAERGAEGDPS
jgi:hypothetical protein